MRAVRAAELDSSIDRNFIGGKKGSGDLGGVLGKTQDFVNQECGSNLPLQGECEIFVTFRFHDVIWMAFLLSVKTK